MNKEYLIGIKYSIADFNHSEESILSGYKKGEKIYLGNDKKDCIIIKEIFPDKVIFSVKRARRIFNKEEFELKKLEKKVFPFPVNPSPKIEFKLMDIWEEEKRNVL